MVHSQVEVVAVKDFRTVLEHGVLSTLMNEAALTIPAKPVTVKPTTTPAYPEVLLLFTVGVPDFDILNSCPVYSDEVPATITTAP